MRGPLCGGGPLGGPLRRCLLRLNRDLHTQPSAATAAAAARSRPAAAAPAAAATAAAAPAAGPVPSRAWGPHEWEGQSRNCWGPPKGPLFRLSPEGPLRSSRGGWAPLPLCWGGSREVANFADAAAAAKGAEAAADERGDRGSASGRILTFSEMLEEEDSLSGLSDVYNNQRTLGSLLSRAQMHHQRERAKRVERERVASEGLSPAACRQVQYKGFVPSLARRIPFEEYYIFDPPKISNKKNAEKTQRNSVLQHIPLSHETFAEMQTSGNDVADAFDLILGLCHFCRSDDDERIKATFALFDKEGKGRLHFFVVAAVFHHLHRILLTPYVADMFRRARVTFSSVDDLAVASAIEIFKAKYPFLSAGKRQEKGTVSPTAATATGTATPAAAASAAAACARNKLFIDLTEEPWKSVACHAGLELSYEDFARVCQDIPKIASMNQTCLLRLPLIVTLRDLIDVEPAY